MKKQPYCPARCKRTGHCHGTAYFKAKPGPWVECCGDCPARREWQLREDKREKHNEELQEG